MEEKLKELGTNCPDCNSFVYTPLEQILFGNKIECKNCTLKFMLNKNSSAEILKQLQEMNFAF